MCLLKIKSIKIQHNFLKFSALVVAITVQALNSHTQLVATILEQIQEYFYDHSKFFHKAPLKRKYYICIQGEY